MGMFSSGILCSICGKETKLMSYKFADGVLCGDCLKLSNYTLASPIRKITIENAKENIAKQNVNKDSIQAFKATKVIGGYIQFDEDKKQWLVPDGFGGKVKNPRVYKFEDIIEYELLEDGDSVTKGGLGRAVAGGLLLGGIGAVVGGVTGKKKNKTVINSLKVKITVNDFQNPAVFINLIQTATKSSSFIYKSCYQSAQQIMSTLALIQKQIEVEQQANKPVEAQQPNSVADEILKFKQLLDIGAISQEEFDQKKKQLLNI
jgi:hypothetical protein